MSGKRVPPAVAEDLEATAELPVSEYASEAVSGPDSTASTDVYPVPGAPAGVPELADGLRDAEYQLARERRRAQELEAELSAANQRQAEFEARLAAADERQSVLVAQLTGAGEREAMLEAEFAAARTRLEGLEAQMQSRVATGHQAAARHRAADLAELQRRCERQQEALTSWQGFRSASDALLAELEARNAELEAQIARMSESLRTPAPAASPLDVEKRALKSELTSLKSELSALHAALEVSRERQQQSEQRADAEATRARRFETEIQASLALLSGQPRNPERPGRDDTGKRAALVAPADTPLRVLVRMEGGTEVVYPIGRRTSIGRTLDNDIQIDTANVSRHHAVLLSSADQCVVEDLNSTNGVVVNGQRIERQVLRDGDVLRVGKVEFRFQQRS